MAKFRTDYKDEVVDSRPRQILDAGTGAVIHNNVLVKNTYTPKQVGDKVGATWFNDVGARLNGLVDGTVKVNKAGMLETLDEYGNMHGIMPFYSKDGVIKFNVDATADLPVGNSVRVGNARVFAYTTTTNPVGNDYVRLPLPQGFMGTLIYLNVQNTNIYASRAIVVGATIEGNGITTVFNGAYAGNIQLSVLALTV